MSADFERFLKLSDQERRDVFEAAADRLDTLPSYVEKDFWVCFVLDLLFNRMPKGHPRLLFKGGTALSKAFGRGRSHALCRSGESRPHVHAHPCRGLTTPSLWGSFGKGD
jgi:hypothetical protein